MKRGADHNTVSRRNFLLGTVTAWAYAAGSIPAAGWAESKSHNAIALEIRKRTVTNVKNKTIRVTEGDAVRIDWTTDEAVEIHLHGYNIESTAEPGRTVPMAFQAHTAGRFPVTAHRFGHATIIYLEVLPR